MSDHAGSPAVGTPRLSDLEATDISPGTPSLTGLPVTPQQGDPRGLVALPSGIEKPLGLHDQIADLGGTKAQIEDDAHVDRAVVDEELSLGALRECSSGVCTRLGGWGHPDAQTVRHDRAQQDVQASDQFRSAHGKGTRTILHAEFTLRLAQYCLDLDIGHPGLVVLDSPLVTHRPPDTPEDEEADAALPAGIIAAFHRDLQSRFDGQVVIMENLDPTEPLDGDSVGVVLAKRSDQGHHGYFQSKVKADA